MKTKKYILTFCILLLLITSQINSIAQESSSSKAQISIFGGVGISNAYGDYPSEYNSAIEFSFRPGVRLGINEIFNSNMKLFLDFGYLKVAYKGFVDPTDTYFYNSYDFLALDAMGGTSIGETGYFSGGLYFAKSLGGDSYREYTDEWISLSAQNDFGLVAEIGKNLGEYFTIGVQGRFGLKSIGKSIDQKIWAIHGRLAFNIFKF